MAVLNDVPLPVEELTRVQYLDLVRPATWNDPNDELMLNIEALREGRALVVETAADLATLPAEPNGGLAVTALVADEVATYLYVEGAALAAVQAVAFAAELTRVDVVRADPAPDGAWYRIAGGRPTFVYKTETEQVDAVASEYVDLLSEPLSIYCDGVRPISVRVQVEYADQVNNQNQLLTLHIDDAASPYSVYFPPASRRLNAEWIFEIPEGEHTLQLVFLSSNAVFPVYARTLSARLG